MQPRGGAGFTVEQIREFVHERDMQPHGGNGSGMAVAYVSATRSPGFVRHRCGRNWSRPLTVYQPLMETGTCTDPPYPSEMVTVKRSMAGREMAALRPAAKFGV